MQEYARADRDIILIQENTGHKMFDSRGPRLLARPKYLAALRNRCQDELQEINGIFPIDYVIVIDLDLEGGWSYDGILNSFAYDLNGWSAMTANGIEFVENTVTNKTTGESESECERLFYDTWAYKGYGDESVLDSESVNEYRFERGESPFQVFSNFNGLGIYKFEDMIKSRFDAKELADGTVLNEWSCYHQEMRKLGKKIFLNPSLITLYSPHEFSFIL